MGSYNNDQPYVLGMQWAPLAADQVLLDPSVEVGYEFRAGANPNSSPLTAVRVFAPLPPGRAYSKQLAANVFWDGEAAATGPNRKLLIPCTSGEAVAQTLLSGATSFQEAVANPSDHGSVIMTGPSAIARFWFGVAANDVVRQLRHRRIIDVSVLYAITGPFDDFPGTLSLALERPSARSNWYMDTTLTGPADHMRGVMVRRVRLGELNPYWSPTLGPTNTPIRLPWKHVSNLTGATPVTGLDALAGAGGTNINVRLETSAGAPAGFDYQVEVHYLALEVTYALENRAAGGGLDIDGGARILDGQPYFEIPLAGMTNYGSAFMPQPGSLYGVTVGESYRGLPPTTSIVPIVVDRLGQIEPFPAHRGLLLRKTLRERSTPTMELTEQLPPLALMRADGTVDPGSHLYRAQIIGTVSSEFAAASNSQLLVNQVAGTYRWVKFYARCQPTTLDPLQVGTVDGAGLTLASAGRISVDEFDKLPELGNGWKEIVVRLDPPVVLTAGGSSRVGFHTSAGAESAWQILGADHNPASTATSTVNAATFQGEAGYATHDGIANPSADFAVMLLRDMDSVVGFAVTPAVQQLAAVDGACGRPAGTVPTGIHYHRLSWDAINSAMVAGWGHYEVQRQDDTMGADNWDVIAEIVHPQVSALDDYEARVGVATRYRIRTVHRTGLAGPWAAVVAATIPVPGVTGTAAEVGVLILTGNHRPAANLAYVMTWERPSPEEFTFPEAGDVEFQRMYQRDFRVAFRPTERGGVEFTRTVLVNAAAVPPAALDAGFRQLRDLAWDAVPYVCVRDEMASRWLSTVLVPSGTVQRRPSGGRLQLAQLTVVETTDTPAPLDGGDATCEGLRIEGKGTNASAEAATSAADLATVVWRDGFSRTVGPGGWGSWERPVQAWQVTGRAADLSVGGSAGRIVVREHRNSNPFFETNVAGWTASGGSAVRTTSQFHKGASSLLLTPNGTSASVRLESERVPGVTPGDAWRGSAWVRCAVARVVTLSITWYDATGTSLGSGSVASANLAANTWTHIVINASAPAALIARASLNVAMSDTPAATHLLYIDEAFLAPAPTGKGVVSADVAPEADLTVRCRVRSDTMATGSDIWTRLILRFVDDAIYRAHLFFTLNGFLSVHIDKVVAGVATNLAGPLQATDDNGQPITYAPGTWVGFQFEAKGEALRAGAWRDGQYPGFTVRTVDAAIAAAGRVGVGAGAYETTTNPSVAVDFDDIELVRSPTDLDIRVEFRPTSDDPWYVDVGHYSIHNQTYSVGGFGLYVSSERVTVDVHGQGTFHGSLPAADVGVTLRQRQWIRAVYRNTVGGGQARADLYRSLDGLTWTPTGSVTGVPEPPTFQPGQFRVDVGGPVTVMRAEVRDGENGPLLAAPNFEGEPGGTVRFTDAAGRQWGVSGDGICGAA